MLPISTASSHYIPFCIGDEEDISIGRIAQKCHRVIAFKKQLDK